MNIGNVELYGITVIRGNPLRPDPFDLITVHGSLPTGQPLPSGWGMTSGNPYSSEVYRTGYRCDVMPEVEPIPAPTNTDTASWLQTLWVALERIPEGALDDDDKDNINTAMAWLKEGSAQ